MRRWLGVWSVALIAGVAGAQQPDPFAASVRALVWSQSDSVGREIERAAVERLYDAATPRPVWTTPGRGPTRQALEAIDVLASADTRGLPRGYADVASLRSLATAARMSPSDAARFDVALSRAIVRLLADLHLGRIDPTAVGFATPNVRDSVDLVALVNAATQADDVAAMITTVEPRYAGYRALQRRLATYRVLATDSSLRRPRFRGSTIRPGDEYPDVRTLARLLTALGDLDIGGVDTIAGRLVYAGAVVDAVSRFQRRHGLDPDGVIGPGTMTELRVPLTQRVRQIELTLERWRWLPDQPPNRYLVVNIPSFRLYAFENDATALRPALEMNVIVGQANGRHNTPVFDATMREVVFNPYWEVPPRIARTELIPIFRRRPEYFVHEEFEIVKRGVSEANATTFPPTPETLAKVATGELRVRQRPGPANALGFIKFVFPNRYNVFLHDTPTRGLFARARRDFSHGCIRVAKPNDLAEFVLNGQVPWDRTAIDSAVRSDRTVHVAVAQPLAVFVVYATAAVGADGLMHFYPDIYKRDATLERALGLAPVDGR